MPCRPLSLLAVLLAGVLPALAPAHAAPIRFARLRYGGGGDWYANPTSLPNLIQAARSRAGLGVALREDTVTLADRRIFDYAMVFVTGHGRISFTAAEAAVLREYLLQGGFLHVDDNYGLDASFRRAMSQVLPDHPLTELPFTHPIYHGLYEFPAGLPKIHEHHGGPPHGYGILHQGRVVVFYSYNTDLSDGWEAPDVHHDPPDRREAALRMGVNIITYALSQ